MTHLQSIPVECDGLLDQSLLSLDVGQVVEGVGVAGVHAQRRAVAVLSLGHL